MNRTAHALMKIARGMGYAASALNIIKIRKICLYV